MIGCEQNKGNEGIAIILMVFNILLLIYPKKSKRKCDKKIKPPSFLIDYHID